MGDRLRGLVGLILGVIAGLWLVTLLSAVLFQYGHSLPGALAILVVLVVALAGTAAGASMGASSRGD